MISGNFERTLATIDWSQCLICQTDEPQNPTVNPLTFIKLRNNPEELSGVYKQVLIYIRTLMK